MGLSKPVVIGGNLEFWGYCKIWMNFAHFQENFLRFLDLARGFWNSQWMNWHTNMSFASTLIYVSILHHHRTRLCSKISKICSKESGLLFGKIFQIFGKFWKIISNFWEILENFSNFREIFGKILGGAVFVFFFS